MPRNARNRGNRGVGGRRDEDGDWRGIRPATTTRAGRRNTAAASCLFFHALFFTPSPARTRIPRETRPRPPPPRRREWTPTAASVSMFERAVFVLRPIHIRRQRQPSFSISPPRFFHNLFPFISYPIVFPSHARVALFFPFSNHPVSVEILFLFLLALG